MKQDIEKLAKEHAEWTSNFLKWVYVEAFQHGYKHGLKDKEVKKCLEK